MCRTKNINGKQCTIVWYMDDNKLSHMDKEVNNKIIEYLKNGDIRVYRGRMHNF